MRNYQLTVNNEQIAESKAKKKRSFVISSLLIAHFSFLIALSSCPSPFIQSAGEELPEGYGSFTLNVNVQRTILPALSTEDIAVYELVFTAQTGTGGEDKTERFTEAPATVTLMAGTYDITLNAYLEGDTTAPLKLAARGAVENVVIGDGAAVSETITIKPLRTTGEGAFKYDVTISASGVTSAAMEITKDGTQINNLTLTNPGTTTGTLTLDAGMYNVSFTLIKDDYGQAIWNEILYVYAELESYFTIDFDEDYFYRTHYNVRFDFNNGETPDYLQTVEHGGTLTEPNAPSRSYTPTAGLYLGSVPEEYVLDYWYDDSAASWNFSNLVLSDMTLTAHWSVPGLVDPDTVSANDVAAAVSYINDNAGNYILLVDSTSPISTPPQTINAYPLTIEGLGSSETTIQLNGIGSLFTLRYGNARLTLGNNITLKGVTGSTSSLVNVENGTLEMNDGSKITGHSTSSFGGGVWVNEGTFTMNGGEISGNSAAEGGGVHVFKGTFTMSGGTISGNSASEGGGVFVDEDTAFTMINGTISDNTANKGGGVYVLKSGTFEMSGSAKVSGNKGPTGDDGEYLNDGGGVYVDDGGAFTMSGGIVGGTTPSDVNHANSGGGVYVVGNGSKFTMSGSAKVSGNSAENGGGVYVTGSGGKFEMSGSAKVSGNKGPPGDYGNYLGDGGGVYVVEGGAFIMSGGTVGGTTPAEFNHANSGGGVYVTGNGSRFTMSDGAVYGNEAGDGGGVHVSTNGTFTMSGGTVSGNKVVQGFNVGEEIGGGVLVIGGTFEMTGTAIVSYNESYGDGGGVFVYGNGTFNMSGDAEVWNNKANTGGIGEAGGGVYIQSSTFTMKDRAKVWENSTEGEGGGVFVTGGGMYSSESTFTMSDNAEVSGNTAWSNGGGVYVGGTSGSTFTMSGSAKVSGNTASYYGGGVFVSPNWSDTTNTFTMNGGTVSGNTADIGGGVYVAVDPGNTTRYGTFRISDGVVYGTNEGINSNTEYEGGAALYKEANGVAQYGTSTSWTNIPMNNGSTTAREETIRVVDGVLATYGISLNNDGSPLTTYTFPAAAAGYGAQMPLTVTVTNTGSQPTGELTVTRSGTSANSYTLSTTSINSITAGGTGTFTLTPNTGLAAGTHTATVTVSGGNGITASFTVSFTVNPTGTAGITTTYWVNENDELAATQDTLTISRGSGHSVTITANGSGYTGQQWYVNGILKTASNDQAAFTFNAAEWAVGTYTVNLMVQKGGAYYSADFTITVTN